MNIFSMFNKKKYDDSNKIVRFNDISFVEPVTNKQFLSIAPNSNYNTGELKKIGSAERLNMFLQQLPLAVNVLQSQQMNRAYKIVFPEGITGTLMKYKNGMIGTPLIGEKQKL